MGLLVFSVDDITGTFDSSIMLTKITFGWSHSVLSNITEEYEVFRGISLVGLIKNC